MYHSLNKQILWLFLGPTHTHTHTHTHSHSLTPTLSHTHSLFLSLYLSLSLTHTHTHTHTHTPTLSQFNSIQKGFIGMNTYNNTFPKYVYIKYTHTINIHN